MLSSPSYCLAYRLVASILSPFIRTNLTLSAYRRVFKVCSASLWQGDIVPIIKVLQFPIKESFKTRVSLEPLKGVWFLLRSKARMHSFSASKDLLISAPSIRVYLWYSTTSAPRSLPAKSINESLPAALLPTFSWIWRIA